MIYTTLLQAYVANETVKRVNNISSSSSCGIVENKHTREQDRFDMILLFMFGMFLGIGYLFEFSGSNIKDSFLSGFWDCSYLMFYFICQLAVYGVSLDDKQPRKAIKTSLILSSVLALIMLVPFICDMDTQIHFRDVVSAFGVVGGPMHYTYHEYTDYTNLIQIGIMVMFCLIDMVVPMYRLYKMRNEQK